MATTIEPTLNPNDTSDFWVQIRKEERVSNWQHYNGDGRHVSPYFVHEFLPTENVPTGDHPGVNWFGKRIGWDVGNKCFRPVSDGNWDAGESGKEYSGWFIEDVAVSKDLRCTTKVSPTDFILAYRAEFEKPRFKKGPSLEGLIARLGYFKNSMTGIRTYITKVNSQIRKDIVPRQLGPDAPAKSKEEAIAALYLKDLASGCSLSRPRSKSDAQLGDFASLFVGTKWEK